MRGEDTVLICDATVEGLKLLGNNAILVVIRQVVGFYISEK